jgi:hypothetical protein
MLSKPDDEDEDPLPPEQSADSIVSAAHGPDYWCNAISNSVPRDEALAEVYTRLTFVLALLLLFYFPNNSLLIIWYRRFFCCVSWILSYTYLSSLSRLGFPFPSFSIHLKKHLFHSSISSRFAIKSCPCDRHI